MATFTYFSHEALARYLVMFGLGELQSFTPITEGIENSNYFVTLSQHGSETHYVLTILESLSFDEAPFFNKLLARLSKDALPVAAPKMTLDGMSSTIFCGKPTFLFPRLQGDHPGEITQTHCYKLGIFIATTHLSLLALNLHRDNPYAAGWMRNTLFDLQSKLTPAETSLLNSLIEEYEKMDSLDLPKGLIHGDLFRDNTLFVNDDLVGVIDFYHACSDFLITDIAIAINDWCVDATRNVTPNLQAAIIHGYESIRSLTELEHKSLVAMQRISAGRFALTRYLSGDPPLKNPAEMLKLAENLS